MEYFPLTIIGKRAPTSYYVVKESPVTGTQLMAGPFPTRAEADAAWESHPAPKYGLWYVTEHAPVLDTMPFGPTDGDWSSWLAQNNID